MKKEETLLELEAPIKICGDFHGQFHDMLQMLEIAGDPANTKFLIMGDYVDRGQNSVEVICLLLALKLRYRTNIYLLRGNHESEKICQIYGFYDEIKRRYNISLWRSFVKLFDYLPIAALIDERILCMHGGLSPELVQ